MTDEQQRHGARNGEAEPMTTEELVFILGCESHRLESRCDANKNFAIGEPFARSLMFAMREAAKRLSAPSETAPSVPLKDCEAFLEQVDAVHGEAFLNWRLLLSEQCDKFRTKVYAAKSATTPQTGAPK